MSNPSIYPETLSAERTLFDLHDRVAIVTGAAGLLGRRHCAALSAAGAHVVALDIHADAVRNVAEEISEESGVNAIGIAADITGQHELRTVCKAVMNWHGRIDVLVNNAAVNDVFDPGHTVPFEEYSLDAWQRSLDVNLTGAFLCAQVFGSVMAQHDAGSIINIASTYGVVAPDQRLYRSSDGAQRFIKSPVYSVTKGGIIAFTRYLAAYWGRNGVRVNTLTPGGVEHGQDAEFVQRYADGTMLGRMATPDDFEGALLFLASDASKYVTGANIIVDGGWTAW